MDTFDISTVYMAILTSNILLIIISVIICNKKILINAGYKLIAIFLILTAIRFILPIQFPFVTTISLPPGISEIIIEIFVPRFAIAGFDIRIYHLIILIWIAGIIVQIYRFIRTDGMIKRFIFAFGKNVTKNPQYASILKEVYTGRTPIRIFEVSGISTPFLYGFISPYILVPSGQHLSVPMLTYIFKHEVKHFMNHDLWLKFGVQLLNIIYWWNPFSSLLNKQVNLVIEMRIDNNITDVNSQEACEYLKCLFDMAEYQDTVLDRKMANAISFVQRNETDLTRRFTMLMKRGQKKNHGVNAALLFFVILIYICSYLFILEADYVTSEVNETSFASIGTDFVAVKNEDETYDIYLSGIHIETTESLKYYDDEIPILTMEEFQNVLQENTK